MLSTIVLRRTCMCSNDFDVFLQVFPCVTETCIHTWQAMLHLLYDKAWWILHMHRDQILAIAVLSCPVSPTINYCIDLKVKTVDTLQLEDSPISFSPIFLISSLFYLRPPAHSSLWQCYTVVEEAGGLCVSVWTRAEGCNLCQLTVTWARCSGWERMKTCLQYSINNLLLLLYSAHAQ